MRSRAEATIKRLGLAKSYPFPHHFFDSPMGAMHFLDEGPRDAPVLLMLHGNPSWSFLYRRFVTAFSDTHRVIAPDHIGFGLSDKPEDENAYSIDAHVRNLEGLVEALDLRDVTLVMQDWGGPIGLGMAARHPERVSRLVILNTFGFYPPVEGMDPEKLKLPPPLLLMRSRGVGDFLVRRLGFFERMAMPTAIGDKSAWRAVRHAYTGIFQSTVDRAGVMAFPRLIPTNTRHPSARLMQAETGPFLDAFDGPARIFWGMKDPFFPNGVLDAWRKKLPQAEVTELPKARHYIQEDAPDEVIAGLRAFIDG
ncbi:alpha/beta fold hydrolase [Aestuariibius insulae]